VGIVVTPAACFARESASTFDMTRFHDRSNSTPAVVAAINEVYR
jgi:hypothetical protein